MSTFLVQLELLKLSKVLDPRPQDSMKDLSRRWAAPFLDGMLEEVVEHGVARGLVHHQLEVVGPHAVVKFKVVQQNHFPETLCCLQGGATMLRVRHP